MEVKEITFKNKKIGKHHFDLVSLEDILNKKPNDHSQFDYHKISFFAIVLISDGNGKHGVNYNDYDYEAGTVFTLRKSSIHKFYKTNARGKLLIFTENFVVRYSDKMETLKLFQLFNEMLSSPKLQLTLREFFEIEHLFIQIENEYLEIKDDHSIEIVRSLMQILIHKLFRIKSKKHEVLNDKKYHSKFISLQELVEKECFESKKVAYPTNLSL